MSQQKEEKKRLIVLTDIEADPDDSQSLIRLLLYTNEIDVEGIIATTSVHQKSSVHPESIRNIIAAYGKVQPNLNKNARGYPTAKWLAGLVKSGRPEYGMTGVGQGKANQGADWIIRQLEKDDPRPLWVAVWGGSNTLAQALLGLKGRHSSVTLNRLIKKLRVYAISDQDDSGIWIRNNFPYLFYIVSPGGYSKATWAGINTFVPGINNETISNSWIASHIQQNHGVLGTMYPDVAYGMEGDTPSWLALIPNGLNDAEHPDRGGWGGRYELYIPKLSDLDVNGFTGGVKVDPETRPIWTNANDHYSPKIANDYGRAVKNDTISFMDNKVTLWRWRDDFQNDFAARMDWTTKSYRNANHPPVPRLANDNTIMVRSSDNFTLDATGTSDPDGDSLSYLWFQYQEASTYKKPIETNLAENLYKMILKAPKVDKIETIEFVLKVTDKGSPPLSRYKRITVKVIP